MTAQSGDYHGYGNGDVQVIAVSLKQRVRFHPNTQKNFAAFVNIEANDALIINTGRYLGRNTLCFGLAPFAAACCAGFANRLSPAVAMPAGLLKGKKAALSAHLSRAAAGTASNRGTAGLSAATAASAALLRQGKTQFFCATESGFFKT